MMINVFVFRVIARVSRFIISIGILDLQLQEIYGMSALCTRSDSVESGHTSDGVLCLRDGDLPCIENKNKRSQRKACLPLERQPIDGL